MTAALSVDTDALEHAAADLAEASPLIGAASRIPLPDGLYRGIEVGPEAVRSVLRALQQRTEEAHAIAARLAALCEGTADRLLTSARAFREADELDLGGS